MSTRSTLGRLMNGILNRFGLRLSRVQRVEDILDPAARSIAMGNSASTHNARDNMDAIYSDPNFLTHYITGERLAFYKLVREQIEKLGINPVDVFDVGCGAGNLLAEMRKVYPDAHLEGVDFSPESIRVARRLNPELSFAVLSIFELEKTGRQFDLVLCSEVLEHLEDADVAMRNLVAICRPGGTIVVTVPHGRRDTFEGHFNFWTPESFRREFRALAPHVDEVESYLIAVIRSPVGDGNA